MNIEQYLKAHSRVRIGGEWIFDRPEEVVWVAEMCGMTVSRVGWWEYVPIGAEGLLGGGGPMDPEHPDMHWAEVYWLERSFLPDEGLDDVTAYLGEIQANYPDRALVPSFTFADWYIIPYFPSWSAAKWQELLDALAAPGERLLFKRWRWWSFSQLSPEEKQEHIRRNRSYYRFMRAADLNYPWLDEGFLRRTTEQILGRDGEEYGLVAEDFAIVGRVLDKIPEWAGFQLCYALAEVQSRAEVWKGDRLYSRQNFHLRGLWKDLWQALNGAKTGWSDQEYDCWYEIPDPILRRQRMDAMEYGELMLTASETNAREYSLYLNAGEMFGHPFVAIHDRAGRITPGLAERFGMKEYTPDGAGELFGGI